MTTAADVLGVDESATEEEIQAAFREQARRFHPDRFDPEALDVDGIDDVDPDELFRDVKQARDELTGSNSGALLLQHKWENGDPRRDEPWEGGHEQTTGSDGSDDATGSQTEDSPGTDAGHETGESNSSSESDDGPWSSEGGTDDAGIDETIGVNIEDGPEESVSTSGNQTESVLSRRNLLGAVGVGGAGLVAANWLGFFNSGSGTGSDNGRTAEHAVVKSSETIQDAADRVVPGGTLEIPSGTYSQYLSIDVDMSIIAPDGATLLGDDADVTAISVSDVDAEIEGLTIGNYEDGGIHGGGRDSDISISNVTIEDSGTTGLALSGEQVTLDQVTVRNSTGTGVQLTSTATGRVSITDVVATDNEDSGVGVATEGRGIVVTGGNEVVVRDSEATGSGYDNLQIEPGDAQDQTIEIENTFVAGSAARSGISILGSYGEDQVTIRETESHDNAQEGVVIGAENRIESTTLDGVTARGNIGDGVQLWSGQTGTVSITDLVATDNEDSGVGIATEGRGVVITGGEEITIRESEVTGSGYANVHIEPGEARGQTIEVEGTLVAQSTARSGIRVDGSYGDDEVIITDVQSRDNGGYGFDLGGESIQIVDSDASGNEDGELNLHDINRSEAEIQNSF